MTQAAIALEIAHIERAQSEKMSHAGAKVTLAPSTRGMGPNTYLGLSYFWAMMLAALILHLAILVIYGLFPQEKITDIPVRALSFKLGEHDRITTYASAQNAIANFSDTSEAPGTDTPTNNTQKNPITATSKNTDGNNEEKRQKNTHSSEPSRQVNPIIRRIPVENLNTELSGALTQNHYRPESDTPSQALTTANLTNALAKTIASPPPAIAEKPQRYVREAGLPSLDAITREEPLVKGTLGDGIVLGDASDAAFNSPAAIRARYEQEISVWIERHKLYPAEAGRISGRVILRVRVDRQGYVRYYAIEQGSQNQALDRAAIEMIRRANPVPAAPTNYPSDSLIEFLIPIQFEAP